MSIAARKITPVQIVEDVDAAAETFATLGFQPVKAEQGGMCTGWQADNGSHVVVAARALIAEEFGEEVASHVSNRALSYVYVESVPDAIEDLGDSCTILGQTVTSYGTVEAIVETAGGIMIIAERLD
jgi:hypothetical protein